MAVVVYSVNPYRALFDDGGGGARFSFNGVDQYATMPPWAANGKPRQYWFNFIADAVATGTEQVIVSGVDGGIVLEFYLHATLPTMSIRYRSATGTQAIEQLVGIDIVPGDEYVIHVINLGTGSEVYVNTVQIDILAFEASAGIQPALTHMGAGHEVARFFGGQLWSDRLVDDSPINDTYANMGDINRYGELEQAIDIPAGNAWSVSIDTIKPDTRNMFWFSDGTADYRMWQTSVDEVRFAMAGGISVSVDALAHVSGGQHFNIELVSSGVIEVLVLVDGVQQGGPVGNGGNGFRLSQIGVVPVGGVFGGGAAMQNIVVKDLTAGITWNYPLDEGSGTDIINSDPSTPGYNGSWTPDTDWQFIDNNTRYYPMNEGEGATLLCYDGNGDPVPTNDATIQNYTDNWT